MDRRAIETIGAVLEGSERPLLVTSWLALLAPGRVATEEDVAAPGFPRVSEAAARALAARGVRASAVRLPPTTHGAGDHGFVPRLHAVTEEGVPFKDIAAMIGRHLKLPVVSKTPEEAEKHFGWFARFAAIDVPTSSARTRALLSWEPRETTLLPDMEQHYF
jgi:hypothetical protein